MVTPPPLDRFGMAGSFHSGTIIQGLLEAARSSRHVLLTGPSGAGKELAASALCRMLSTTESPLPMLDYNAARFTSEDEATATLFGVAPRVFSNVDARPGLIEQARGGVLFLDEVHNLPVRVQRSLLRTIEGDCYSRIGESKRRSTEVTFVLASNEPPPGYGLAHDLLARLRVVTIPPLRERIADIPDIFMVALSRELERNGLGEEAVFRQLGADHFEAMCLDGFAATNVRGILDLVDRLVAKMVTGIPPKEAVAVVFQQRFGNGPVATRHATNKTSQPATPMGDVDTPAAGNGDVGSHYEVYRKQIEIAFEQCRGNLTATERMLRSSGIRCSRRWLGIYTKKWGLR